MSRALRSLTWLLLLVPMSLACGKLAEDDDGSTDSPSDGAPAPGDPCDELNSTRPAGDDCNTCTCTEDGWSCTELNCDPLVEPCAPGDTTDHDCNSCWCTDDATWACTLIGCPQEPTCTPGSPKEEGCMTCVCSEDGSWACDDGECPDPVCEEGATESDGCNTCTCLYGAWACTARDCSSECVTGEEKVAEDDCNICTCTEDGFWACTESDCSPLNCGNELIFLPCAEDEFCNFVSACGQDGSSGKCEKRPTGCTKENAPVCGCNDVTYDNACSANVAGMDVASEGECEAP